MTMERDILKEIIAHKCEEVETQKRHLTADQLVAVADEKGQWTTHSLRQALATSPTGIIAEFKRRSPSKGWINREARPDEIIPQYKAAGAAALSILTDEAFFAGRLGDLTTARPLTALPILRKDFVIDPYQLLQARAAGADAVLFIAACLDRSQCSEMAQQAHELGLEVLLELHSPDELNYLDCRPDLVGVNNRSLGTFHTDASHAVDLAEALAQATASTLRRHGYRGLLIGERFMRSECPGDELHAFIQQMSHLQTSSAL